jgi:hypothetical protein
VLNQVGEEQDGRWRWEVLDGLYAAVQRFGQRLSENVVSQLRWNDALLLRFQDKASTSLIW